MPGRAAAVAAAAALVDVVEQQVALGDEAGAILQTPGAQCSLRPSKPWVTGYGKYPASSAMSTDFGSIGR